MTEEDIVGRLFDAFGKRISKGQGRLYMDWVDKAGLYAEDIIESSIQNDSTFPPLSRLNHALLNCKSNVGIGFDPSVERCYYCCDTGVVPYLYDPEGKSGDKYYTRMFACKCSNAVQGITNYFYRWGDLQFEQGDYEENYLYPHVVDAIKMEKNGG